MLKLPPSLYVLGTVNVDETTYAFSPKVLDSAFTLEFTEVDFSGYPPEVGKDAVGPSDEERAALLEGFTFDGFFARIEKSDIAKYVESHPDVRERLQGLNGPLQRDAMHFGYRVFDEIVCFLDSARANEVFADPGGEATAFDAAVLMKVLPKFHGSRGKLERPLRAILAWCADPDNPQETTITEALKQVEDGRKTVEEALGEISFVCSRTADKLKRMLSALDADGFAGFG